MYVLREVLVYTLVGLAAISFVFVAANLMRRLGDLLEIGVAMSDVMVIVRAIGVVTLAYTVPIAFLFGALVGLARMAADSEITAMRACGIGLAQLVAPVVALGVVVACLTWVIALEVEHRAKREIRDTIVALGVSGKIIQPGRFTQVGDRMLYVESRDRRDRLRRVFIADQSNPDRPLLLFAESGEVRFDPDEGRVHLRLRRGDLHLEGGADGDDPQHMTFARIVYSFAISPQTLGGGELRPQDLSMAELYEARERARAGMPLPGLRERTAAGYEVQIHRRLALPMAPILFALLAVPLALRPVRGARAFGALLCGLVIAVYYGVLSFSQYLAMEGFLPAALALWLPNAFLAGLAALLLDRARRIPR
jgi:lipopolysaccharide export system permease protein